MKAQLCSFRAGASNLRDAALFVALTYAQSWLFWVPGALLRPTDSAIADFMLALGSLTPLAVAFYLNRWAGRTTFHWTRWLKTLAVRGIAVAFCAPVALLLPSIMFGMYAQGFSLERFLTDAQNLPTLLLGFSVLAFGEEAGWRGFLLPRLQGLHLPFLNAVMGLAWGFWQLPLVVTYPGAAAFEGAGVYTLAFLVFALLITPFFTRLALRYDVNVLLPTLLRAALYAMFAVYSTQAPFDLWSHPYGIIMLAWLVVLSLALYPQLWQGKRAGGESELERVLPLEAVK